jgi:hypothetical protein
MTMKPTPDRVEQLLRMRIESLADVQFLEEELKREIELAEAEERVRDSIRLKHKLLELRQRKGIL